MKKYSNLFIVSTVFATLILIFINSKIIANNIILSFTIWFNNLIPSMMPMIILSDILISYNFQEYIPKKIMSFISKIFNISSYGSTIFIMSLISGFPCNAIIINTLYEDNKITINEANHLLIFCNFANPLFIIETIGVIYLKNIKYALIILISNIISNIILGIITKKENTFNKINYIPSNIKSQSFSSILSNSINKCINALLNIGITITLFLILSTLIINIFKLNNNLSLLIKGILEMTMALAHLSKMAISIKLKVIISSVIVSFSGLSIHMQVINSLNDKIKYKYYFMGRVSQAIISFLLTLILLLII